jgi:hypothetical protein
MSHLDEGMLHALLDGELETHEVAEVQAHLGSCSACGLRLREVKEFHTEADRLIASVDLQAPVMAAPRPTPLPAAPAPALAERETRRETPPRPQPPAAPAQWEPWNQPPPLLLPDNESMSERRMRRMRRFGWAAIILVIAGAGFVEVQKMIPAIPEEIESKAGTLLRQAEPNSTKQPAGAPLAKTDSAPAGLRPAASPTGAAAGSLAAAPTPVARREAKPAAAPVPTVASDRASALQVRRDTGVLDEEAIDKVADTGEGKQEADSAASADLVSVRERASEALAELDRERRLKQAAAATAALDARRRNAAAPARAAAPATVPAPTASPPPAPPTLEQRAQVYLRIGLDEASRQLGGPAHVIEGLSPLFMGLVQGGAVPSADGTRPVVRVVYQDSQGRLILLDQQRLRAGQSPPAAAPLTWTIGGTAMWLNGEAGSDILRTYRPRVR